MPAHHTVYKISPSPDSTLAIEIRETGLVKRKHLLVFEQYSGALIYDPEEPLESVLNLSIEVSSLACRGAAEKARRHHELARDIVEKALQADKHPALLIESRHFSAKPLRGFVVELAMQFRGIERQLKANLGFGALKRDRLQIDADATLRLSDYALPRPASLFGLVRTEDEVTLHALIWGVIN